MPESTQPFPGTALSCIRCSYPLPSLDAGAVCPECGTPAEETLRENVLACADKRYLESLKRGLEHMFWSTAAMGLGATFTVVALVSDSFPLPESAAWTLWAIWIVAIGALWPLGVRRLTIKEEPCRASMRQEAIRRWARGSALAQAICTPVAGAATVVEQTWSSGGQSVLLSWFKNLSWGVVALVLAVQFVATMVYLQQLAHRIPSRTVRRGAQVVLVMGVVAVVGGVGGTVLWPVGCVSSVAVLALPFALGGVIYTGRREIRALLRLAREREAADAARAAASP